MVCDCRAIVDPESGEQPLLSTDGNVMLAANGEIYNHMTLKAGMLSSATFLTGSDCEVIIPLWVFAPRQVPPFDPVYC
jgi:asparagine synthase (glutamine-hydrolysing)